METFALVPRRPKGRPRREEKTGLLLARIIEPLLEEIQAEIKAILQDLEASDEPVSQLALMNACKEVFLKYTARTGMPVQVADAIGIPYRQWLLYSDRLGIRRELEAAIEEGEMRLLEWSLCNIPLDSKAPKTLRAALATRRPRRYMMKYTVKEEPEREIKADEVFIRVTQALKEAGMSDEFISKFASILQRHI